MSFPMMLDSLLLSLGVWTRCAIIALAIALMAAIALWRRFLDIPGTAAAAALGFIVFYIGGVSGFVLLLYFFLSSSVITKLCRKGEGSRGRGYPSVVANGFPSSLALILYAVLKDPVFLLAFAASIAEAASDTWAGEIGQLSHDDPVSIATFTKVPKGISGGVTVLGLLASLAASLSVALLFWGTFGTDLWGLLLIAASGFLGALFDSLLGATLQVQYRRKDGSLTEDPKEGERARGVPFMDNDAVNLLSGLFAFSVAVALYSL